MENQSLAPRLKTWQLSLGFANTNVIYAMVKSGVTEQLRDNPKTLEQLSVACRLDSDVLFRVLQFAIAIDVIALNNNQYSLDEIRTLLQNAGLKLNRIIPTKSPMKLIEALLS